MFSHMLDTNIVIYVIKRRPLEVLEAFNRYAGKMVISSITYGELVHGGGEKRSPSGERQSR